MHIDSFCIPLFFFKLLRLYHHSTFSRDLSDTLIKTSMIFVPCFFFRSQHLYMKTSFPKTKFLYTKMGDKLPFNVYSHDVIPRRSIMFSACPSLYGMTYSCPSVRQRQFNCPLSATARPPSIPILL